MMIVTIKKRSVILVSVLLTGCTYYYSPNSNYPLAVEVNALKKGNTLQFFLSHRYENLSKYYVKSIRVEKTREDCNEPQKSSPKLIWHIFSDPNRGKFKSSTQRIDYKHADADLDKDTLYKVKVIISKFDGSRQGFGESTFAILPKGKLSIVSTYQKTQELCGRIRY